MTIFNLILSFFSIAFFSFIIFFALITFYLNNFKLSENKFIKCIEIFSFFGILLVI